jgi:hypothetical protein
MTPYHYQKYPILVIRLERKASPKSLDIYPFAEEKHENFNHDLRCLRSIHNPGLRKFSSYFIGEDTEAREPAQPILELTPSASAAKETGLEESELTNRLKLAIGIPVNEEQSSPPIITELFIKARNLLKSSEAYGGLEATYGKGSLEILTNLLSQELENHKLRHSDTTLNESLRLKLTEILQKSPAEPLMSIL